MTLSHISLIKGATWTSVTYLVELTLRFMTNISLAHLLAPELFGIMTLVNSIRTGIDLISDVGIEQNVIFNPNGDKPEFYHTAWTLHFLRSSSLWLICIAAAAPVASIYETPILTLILPIAGFFFVLVGMCSMGAALLRRRMQFARLNLFTIAIDILSTVIAIGIAYFNRTVWALVFGGLASMTIKMIGTYLMLPSVRPRFYISKEYMRQIFTYGKWITLSSIVYFLSMNFDRLYLGRAIPFSLLGIYGISRTLSETFSGGAVRLGNFVIFPLLASVSSMPREKLRKQLASLRLKFFLSAALGLSLFASLSDLLINILYDQRYEAATGMLSILVLGSWFSILCSFNEATLFGFGKPAYSALAHFIKFVWLAIAIPVGLMYYGIMGAVIAVALADCCRYIPLLVGQLQERFSFAMQDLACLIVVFGLILLLEHFRFALGLGTSFDGLEIVR